MSGIVVLEGLEGTGKTTVSKAAAIAQTKPRIYRALRHGDKWGPKEVDGWHALGVPANTFVEDVFAVDTISKLLAHREFSIILDRSLPSGLVYNDQMWDGDGLTNEASTLLDWWVAKLDQMGGIVAYFDPGVEYIVDILMTQGRPEGEVTVAKRHRRMGHVIALCEMALPVLRLDISMDEPDEMAARINQAAFGYHQQALPGVTWATLT